MSVSTEVQRTLVKSPPELWAELSSAESLARHLGEVGEIRVTKVEPETRLEWEADQVSGVVELAQSGWGTKVTLSLTHVTPEPEPMAVREIRPEPEPIAEVVVAEGEQRGGFFARLFKRKPQPPLAAEPADSSEPDPEPELQALALPEPVYPPAPPKPVEPAEATGPAAELAEIEARLQQESTELLTGVLDRLGAAHHRPFSRA